MARPTRCRRICIEPAYDSFRPEGIPTGEKITMTVDEYEVIRLVDLKKYTHEQCAQQMGISRTTVTEIYESARYKLADSLVHGKVLSISGGNYCFCDGRDPFCCNQKCERTDRSAFENKIQGKGEKEMRIGVTYETERFFSILDTQSSSNCMMLKMARSNRPRLSIRMDRVMEHWLPSNAGVEVLICGGIGGGAQAALAAAGIQLFGGVSGDADEAVRCFVSGNLNYNPEVRCSHHAHEHSCGEHHCGENKNGCSGH